MLWMWLGYQGLKTVLDHFGGPSTNYKVLMKRHVAGSQKGDDIVMIEMKDGREEP